MSKAQKRRGDDLPPFLALTTNKKCINFSRKKGKEKGKDHLLEIDCDVGWECVCLNDIIRFDVLLGKNKKKQKLDYSIIDLISPSYRVAKRQNNNPLFTSISLSQELGNCPRRTKKDTIYRIIQ